MKNSVFISYSRADKDKVIPFVQQINERLGDICWFDINDIESGDLFENNIKTAIKYAKVILFFYSKESLASEWTYREMLLAKEYEEGKSIVPIVFDDNGIGGWFKVIFGNKDFKHYKNEEHLTSLFNDLAKWVGVKQTHIWKKDIDGFHVLFPNGQEVRETKVVEALKSCIIEIGIKKVFELHLYPNKDALIFKRKPEGLGNIEEIRQGKSTYYIQRLQGRNVLEMLRQISELLNLGLTIYSQYSEEEEPPKDYVAEIELKYHEVLTEDEIQNLLNKACKYMNGTETKKPNYKKAHEYFCRAAGAGSSYAWIELGFHQEEGFYEPVNFAAAFSFYTKAHDLSDPYGTLNIALCYIKGHGVEKDVPKGIEIANDVINKQELSKDTIGHMSFCIASALDYDDALPFYQKAIENGYEGAQARLDSEAQYRDCAFALIVDDVFSITGRGTVVVGNVSVGSVTIGDEVTIMHNGEEYTALITGIEMYRKLIERAEKGDNVGLLLRGVDPKDIQCGDALTIKK